MKSHLSRKINFLKICLALCVSVLLFACDLFQETPKDFLEDYGNIASVAKTEFSVKQVSQGAWQNIGSGGDVTINYVVENPGEHRLRAEISFPNNLTLSDVDFKFPENDDLLKTWTEEVDDGAGGTTTTTRMESETNFLKSTFSITFLQSFLDTIDGKVLQYDISPTVKLYRADYGAEERPQSSHTIRLLCNTPPADIPNAIGEKIVDADGEETLVLAIELPTLKSDDKTLTVEENGWTHVFEKAEVATDFNGATSSDGLWTISSTAPAGIEAATYDNDGNAITPADKGWTPNCYITTDIDIKGLAPFGIVFTLTDDGGLTSQKLLPSSHGRKLDPPYSISATTLEQDESDGMATYTLQATDGATIHCTVTPTEGNAYDKDGASPLAIRLPAGDFTITAHAEKKDFAKSDNFTSPKITVNPSVFFVSAEGSDTDGNGAKSKPFATIKKAVESFTSASPTIAKIFILSDLEISDNETITLSPATGTDLNLQGCKGGSAGSQVTISCALTSGSLFVISGSVNMRDLNISQTSSSIASGGVDKAISVSNGATLNMENISISGMKTSSSGISLENGGTLNLKNVSITGNTTANGALVVEGNLNISGGVKIIGNTAASGGALNLYLPDGKTLAINSGSLSETQIGVTTETEPNATDSVIITSGFSGTNYTSVFSSDKDFALSLNAENEVQLKLKGAGGTIKPITPPSKITFSFDANDSGKNSESGTGGTITIYAFADDGTPIAASEFTNWMVTIRLGGTTTGLVYLNSIPFPLDSQFNTGTYYLYVQVKYGDKEYSDELTYNYTKT